MIMGAKTTYKPLKKINTRPFVCVLLLALWPVGGIYASPGHPVVNEYLTSLLPLKDKVKTVCIDPGHGGHDPGCHGVSAYEKNVALAIGLKLGKLIETHFPDVKVVYTRKTDVFVELHKRAEIANKADADLFICIHCNAGPEAANGSETYALGLHKTEANLAVAKRENEAVLLEDDYKVHYDGFDVNSPEGSIIFSLYQNTFLNRSLSFAAKCQKYFGGDAGRYNRGVKQAGFLVLWKTAMPAVLIETGFLSNRAEEKFLADPDNQDVMARAIFKAFTDYKNELEGTAVKPDLKQPEKLSESGTPKEEPANKDPKPEKTAETDTPVFKVQFYSSPTVVATNSAKFKGIDKVAYYRSANGYGYTAGESASLDDMKKLQDKLRTSGYPDAFVVAFAGGNRISVKEAMELLKKKQ